ncbi:conserved hypothetical protein [Brugia malayi]|uniref:SprT-like domain-containing protein n=1 Tax=Brugia malayi TaxID=6279 RepID=A0A4E9FHN9_BRUMA|nr:uncharacterized protein BM_BM7449 [Brugia malayi]VIO95779.1 conserved hypothetical protein [Brugia malayi]
MSQYQRIIISDSSTDDDNDNDDESDKDIDEVQSDIYENDENSGGNIQDISRLLETLSFTRRNTYGHRVDRTDDEATSVSDDTYLEDSFLVKDYTSSEENSSNISNDEKSYRKKESTYNRQRQKIIRKELEKESAEFSSFFKSDLSDASIDSKKVSTLFELYPELKENVNLKRNSLNNYGNKICNELALSDEDSDEKFEKYLKEVKTQSSVTKTYKSHDLDGLIMSDSEFNVECNSECESSSSDDVQLIENINKDKHANMLLESQSVSNTQKTSYQDDDEIFLLALSQSGPVHRVAQKYTTAKFPRIRKELTAKLFDVYRRRCFENKLDPNMVLNWNARLRLTAGRCRCKPNGTADIELSIKVCDTPERLRDTLLHEMCHAAVWVIDHIHKGRHGPAWKYWVHRCQKVFPSLPLIERCHNYIIDAKYLYVCDRCGQTIKRHSKSLDIDRKICGICQGHFILRSRDGKEFLRRRANTFAQFVKENYGKERKPGVKPAEIMKILSLRFKEQKGMASETGEIITVE